MYVSILCSHRGFLLNVLRAATSALNDNATGNSTCPPQEEPPTMTIVGLNLGIALSLIFGCMAGQVFGVDWKPKRK